MWWFGEEFVEHGEYYVALALDAGEVGVYGSNACVVECLRACQIYNTAVAEAVDMAGFRVGNLQLDATHDVDEITETIEVSDDVFLYIQIEILVYDVNSLPGSAIGEGCVKLVVAAAVGIICPDITHQ